MNFIKPTIADEKEVFSALYTILFPHSSSLLAFCCSVHFSTIYLQFFMFTHILCQLLWFYLELSLERAALWRRSFAPAKGKLDEKNMAAALVQTDRIVEKTNELKLGSHQRKLLGFAMKLSDICKHIKEHSRRWKSPPMTPATHNSRGKCEKVFVRAT